MAIEKARALPTMRGFRPHLGDRGYFRGYDSYRPEDDTPTGVVLAVDASISVRSAIMASAMTIVSRTTDATIAAGMFSEAGQPIVLLNALIEGWIRSG